MSETKAGLTSEAIDITVRNGKKDRAFRILMAGSSISMIGSRISAIAFPLLVLNLSGSPLMAGLVACAAIAPSLLVYVPAGAFVDRWEPSRALLVSETGRGIAIAVVVAALALGGHPSIYVLIVAMLAEEILEIFSTLAERRYISLVKRDDASRAQASVEVRAHAVMLAGRPFGVVLFKLAPILPFAADGLSFVASVVSLIVIRSRHVIIEPPRRSAERLLRHDIREGGRWFRNDKYALITMLLMSCTTLIAQALILIFLAEAHADRLSSLGIGLVLAASGAGGTLGSMVAGRLSAGARASWLQIQMCAWGVALGILAASGGRSFTWTAAAMTILGFTGAIGNIEFGTYLVKNVANGMLARVTSVGQVLAIGAASLGSVLGGTLIQRYDVQSAVSWLFFMMIVLMLISFCALVLRSEKMARFLSPQKWSSLEEASESAENPVVITAKAQSVLI
jgi:MFS family permease